MRRRTVRGRLNAVLLQWFLLLVLVAGTIVALSVPRIRRAATDDRLLLAQTIAHSFDATISSAVQNLGRLAADLSTDDAGTAARLRAFRFQSPFSAATYLMDADGTLRAADPPDATPLPVDHLDSHEVVTSLVSKPGHDLQPVMAISHPFQRDWRDLYLVSEMSPADSRFSRFLRDLGTDLEMHVVVVDANGIVVAARDPAQLYRELADPDSYQDRIAAHRPLVLDHVPCEFEPAGTAPADALMVMVPLRFAPWGVVIQQHEAAALAGWYDEWYGLALAAALMAGMTLLLSGSLSRSIVAPIRELSRQARRIRAGDLSNPVTLSGDEEVETLARTLDEARVRLASSLGQLQALNESLEAQVAARTRAIEALVRRLLGAAEDERRRLARELHDEISQLLTVIQLSLARVDVDHPEMTRARDLLTRTQVDIHRIISDLRPSLLDDLGLSAAIQAHADDHLTRAGIAVNLEIEEDLPPRPHVETAVFRIYQELVTNILRHAKAEHVSVELYERDGRLVLAVEDDGVGFDPAAQSDGVGLTGMRERAALVDGTLTIDSEPGMGTHVVLEIPVS